jgi:hypothetical protein
MSLFRRGDVWWYEFWFAGRRIRESSKSPSKTVAKGAEQKRKRELEEGFNNFTDLSQERIRTFTEMAGEYFDSYKLRLPQSARFAEYAIDHLKRLLGSKMLVDFNETAVIHYQNERLSENAAPKSVNEEVGFLLRILGDPGDLFRIRLRKRKTLKLKVRQSVGKAYTQAEKDRMLAEARKARSQHIYPALSLALNAGMRDGSGPEQDRGRRGTHDSPEFNTVGGLLGVRRLVPGEVRRTTHGMVRLPLRETEPERPISSRHHPEDGMEQRAREGSGEGTLARQPAHAYYRPCRERRRRSDHHGHRRPCL